VQQGKPGRWLIHPCMEMEVSPLIRLNLDYVGWGHIFSEIFSRNPCEDRAHPLLRDTYSSGCHNQAAIRSGQWTGTLKSVSLARAASQSIPPKRDPGYARLLAR